MALPLILRWPDANDPLVKQLGADIVLTPASAPVPNVVTSGLWPGVRNAGGGGRRRNADDVASASAEPWVDANGYLAAFERAIHPDRPAVLGEEFKEAERSVPFETLEVALIEARVNGGNFILSVEPRYRAALEKQDPKALEAWKALANTVAWLKKNESLFGRPTFPTITALVEPGARSAEIANLLYRRSASPAFAPASNPPKPNPGRILALVAASLKSVPEAAYAHAAAGSTVVIDSEPNPSWKLIKKEKDRSFYALGKGQVLAYHKRVVDPSEFALDVIDIVTYKRRAARLWNALASIPLATEGPKPGEALFHIINYGSPTEDEVQARIQGRYAKATLLRPEKPPVELKLFYRNTTTEVFLPGLSRLGVVHFR